MPAVLVDSNVLLDVLTNDPTWADWSAIRLAEAGNSSRLVINPIVYGEISIRFSRIEDPEEVSLPLRSGFSRRQSLSGIPAHRRREDVALARLFHRSPRGRYGLPGAD